MVSNMRHMVFKILKSWYTMHIKNWPVNMFYYRDCVSESQFDNVVTTELPKFKKAFQLLADDLQAKDENGIPVRPPSFKLTAIVVSKRHSTCFFPSKHADAMTENQDCKPRTMVDRMVTLLLRFLSAVPQWYQGNNTPTSLLRSSQRD